jgi:predicted nuclease of predicted toxin-antitoxin system
LIVTTGNIHNDELLRLFSGNLELLVSVLESAHLVELGQDGVEVFEAPST